MKNAIILFALLSASTFLHTQTNPTPIATIEREEVGGGCFGQSMDYGDINGDGVNDLVVADTYYDGPAGQDAGRVYIFFGRNFSGTISATTADIKIDGIRQQQYAGLIKTGNIDGDEYSDIFIGTPSYYDSNYRYETGRVYLFFGKNLLGKSILTISDANLFFYGDTTSMRMDIATVFDFNGDGLDDIFINSFARYYNNDKIGQNRLNVFYSNHIQEYDSINISIPDLYFYGYDPHDMSNSLIFPNNANIRMQDINSDGIADLTVAFRSIITDIQDTISVFFGQIGGIFGSLNYNQGNLKIFSGYDYGGYRNMGRPFFCNIDGSKKANIVFCNAFFHFDPEYNNQYGRVYVFNDETILDGKHIDEAEHIISGTIAGIFSGNFGIGSSNGDINGDGRDELVVTSYGLGYVGNQYLFQGREKYPDSLSDNDAEVKIIGNSSYSGLQNGSIIVDIIGTGRPQWLIAYDKRGSKINGFIDIYPSSVLTGVPDDPNPVLPKNAVLYQNYPNPFNPSTTIKYELPANSKVEIRIYNILGQEVRLLEKGSKAIGEHKIIWDGRDNQGKAVASGIYIYRLQFRNQIISKKMVLVR